MPNWNNERLEEKARFVVLPMLFSAIVLTAVPAYCTSSFSQGDQNVLASRQLLSALLHKLPMNLCSTCRPWGRLCANLKCDAPALAEIYDGQDPSGFRLESRMPFQHSDLPQVRRRCHMSSSRQRAGIHLHCMQVALGMQHTRILNLCSTISVCPSKSARRLP